MFTKICFCLIFYLLASEIHPQSFNIRNFGAVGNGVVLNTKTIQGAIDSCAGSGGGTVYVPAGIFLTGTLELRSNINLCLENGAELKGSPDMTDYKKYQSPHASEISHYGVLFASNGENISITGQGTINGNEEAFFEWDKAKSIEWGGTKFTRQKEKFRESSGIGDGPVVPKERPRQMIIFSGCKNVMVRDVKIEKSPFWTLHFADCDGVSVNGIKIWNNLLTPNSDGIDMTSCSNVTISDCDIRAGDDALVVVGYAYHYELPGYNDLRHPSENICITNCNLQSRSSGIRIGFIDQNSVRNIHISNVNITNSNRGIGIFTRGEGSVENVTISQVTIETRLHTGDWWGNGEPIHISTVPGEKDVKPGRIKGLTFRDITCTSENGILIYGCNETPIEDVSFENLKLKITGSKLNSVAGGNIDLRGALGDKQLFESDLSAFGVSDVKNISLNNVTIDWKDADKEFFKYALHIEDFIGVKLSGITITPLSNDKPVMFFENGSLLQTDMKKSGFGKKNVK